MGWDGAYHWTTKAIAIADILKEFGNTIEAYKSTKSGLWFILNDVDSETKEPVRLIVVALLRKSGGHWMRKHVSEDMGPTETDCPIEFLAMVPSPGGYADEWRKRVLADHAVKGQQKAARAALSIGGKVSLSNGWELIVTSLKPFLGKDADGKVWRIPQRMLNNI
jgi:hypothetical protein